MFVLSHQSHMELSRYSAGTFRTSLSSTATCGGEHVVAYQVQVDDIMREAQLISRTPWLPVDTLIDVAILVDLM